MTNLESALAVLEQFRDAMRCAAERHERIKAALILAAEDLRVAKARVAAARERVRKLKSMDHDMETK